MNDAFWMLEAYAKTDPDPTVEKVAQIIYETNDYLRAGMWNRMFPRQKEPFYVQARAALDALAAAQPGTSPVWTPDAMRRIPEDRGGNDG